MSSPSDLLWPTNAKTRPLRQPAAKPRGWQALSAAIGGTLSDPFRLVLTIAVNLAIVAGIVGTAVILRNHKPPPKPATAEAALSAAGPRQYRRSPQPGPAPGRQAGHYQRRIRRARLRHRLACRPVRRRRRQQKTERGLSPGCALFAALAAAGLSAHRQGTGLYLLGKSLCLCGRLDDALPVLEEAMRNPAGQESELQPADHGTGRRLSAGVGQGPGRESKAVGQSTS